MTSVLLCICALALGAAQGGRVESAVDSALDTTGNLLTGDDFSRIQFTLYTNASNTSYLIADAADLVADPSFDASKPTVLYMHGWMESNESESVGVVSRAFLQKDSHNFVLIDWSPYVAGTYLTSYLRVTAAGAAVGEAVIRMVAAGLSQEGLWPIGHSLGGQLSGVMAKNLDFKPNRITALDPALPGFNTAVTPELSRDDAVMVDVIHTDAGVSGYDANDGTIDLWPNGGRRPQPGCSVGQTDLPDALLFCSHHRSWRFFAESVNNETAFPAVSCRSWLAFQSGSCPLNESNVVFMGYAAPATHQKGTFYLRTASEEPFGLGVDGARAARAVRADEKTTTTTTTTTTTAAPSDAEETGFWRLFG